MSGTPLTAAVIVTCNSQAYLGDLLTSIDNQTRSPDLRIAVDDLSTDATHGFLNDSGFAVCRATSTASDATARIAQNFLQGVRAAVAAGAEVIVLGDHDDVWHRNRVEHQVNLLEDDSSVAFLASDGYLIDEHGAAMPGTIRSTFAIPGDFNDQTLRRQSAYAVRHSIATGGACALRPAAMTDWSIPAGWLHDRWWSLAAVRTGSFLADPTPVIDYRVTSNQQLGLDLAHQDAGIRWIGRKARNATQTAKRARDLSRLITP